MANSPHVLPFGWRETPVPSLGVPWTCEAPGRGRSMTKVILLRPGLQFPPEPPDVGPAFHRLGGIGGLEKEWGARRGWVHGEEEDGLGSKVTAGSTTERPYKPGSPERPSRRQEPALHGIRGLIPQESQKSHSP